LTLLPLKIKPCRTAPRFGTAPQDEEVREIALGLTWPLEEGVVESEAGFDFPGHQTPVANSTL